MNILDLKILQVFFKNRGEILVFEKMLNFLSFLVLLYVSGRFKQKNFFQNFSDWLKIFITNKLGELVMKFFYQSEKKILKKILFAWNVLKRKVKARNSRNSTFFWKKTQNFPPWYWKTL